jgi:hypothetical protein
MLAVLGKGPVELLGPHLPHLFHRILSLLAEFKARGSLIQCGKQTADHALHLRAGKHSHARLHDQILVEQKDFRADARLIGRGIIGARQLFERLSRGALQAGAQQPG